MTTATAAPETTPIAVGAVAPDFTLQDSEKKDWKLADFIGKKPVALFFYPLDWSPTCTKENVCFSQDLSRYGKYAEVVGISIDSVWSHKAWKEKMGLKHTLLADMHRKVCKAYGLYLPAANISQRATVLINKDGKVAWTHVESDITKERDYKELEAQLAKLA
jgi:peroxiredoxin